MKKGDLTRQTVLDHAFSAGKRLGLEGLTIGALAEELGMSKSGLFAHFQSKETLQLAVLEHAGERFVEQVVKPTLKAPRGEPRVRALLTNWLGWERGGGCFFSAATFELDDRPGPVRDRLAQMQRDWLDLIATVVRTAIAEGHFTADVDPQQFAFELEGMMLVTQQYERLLGERDVRRRTVAALDSIIARAKARGV